MIHWIHDMDGVLVDSERFMALAGKAALEEYSEELAGSGVIAARVGIDVVAFEEFTGMGEIKYLSGVAGKYGIPVAMEQGAAPEHQRDIYDLKERAYGHYDRLVDGQQIALPGVPDALYAAKSASSKVAIATGADERKMLTNLRIMGFERDSLDAYVTGDDPQVTKGKPDPQIFQLAVQRLGVRGEDCVVTEDSLNGILAAKRAGLKCVGITTAYSQDEMKSRLGKNAPDWYAPSLAELPGHLQP